MPLVGAFVFPHGAIPLDPQTRDFTNIPAVKPNSKDECIKIHNAMKNAAEDLIKTRSDLIIFSTPHGPRLQNSYLFFQNTSASGNAKWDNDWENFKAEFNVDSQTSMSIANKLRELNFPVDIFQIGLTASDRVPLRWGEVVPWWFISEASKSVPDYHLPPVVLIGQPSRRLISSKAMIPELTKLGSEICRILLTDIELTAKRIAVVISCDLSHYHSQSTTSPFPFHKDAVVFDNICCDWAQIDMIAQCMSTSSQLLLTKAGDIVDNIWSCGYTGLVMLQGMFEYAVSTGREFKARLYHYGVPTYYGMMTNSWI